MNKREYKQPRKKDRLEDQAQTGDREQARKGGRGRVRERRRKRREGGNEGKGGRKRKTSMFTVNDVQDAAHGLIPSTEEPGGRGRERAGVDMGTTSADGGR